MKRAVLFSALLFVACQEQKATESFGPDSPG